MEKKISIPAFAEKINNVYGYIDSWFVFISKDSQKVLDAFNKADLNSIAKKLASGADVENLTYVGNSILYVPGGLSSKEGHLPAHANNFLEIMADGSARMRILLWNNDNENSEVNMVYASSLMKKYKDVYRSVMGELLVSTMAYAKKYEALTTLRQFHPIVIIDDVLLEVRPDLHDHGQKLLDALKKHRMVMGIDTVVTDDRIPKTGLYTIDRRNMANWGMEYTPDTILDELFFSRFTTLGAVIPENDPEVVSDE